MVNEMKKIACKTIFRLRKVLNGSVRLARLTLEIDYKYLEKITSFSTLQFQRGIDKYIWEKLHILYCRETSTKHLCGPCHFLLVHWLNSLFLLVYYSNSNMFFETAERLFNGRREKVKLAASLEYILLVHRYLLDYSRGNFKIFIRER
jgi:hypothetical protein